MGFLRVAVATPPSPRKQPTCSLLGSLLGAPSGRACEFQGWRVVGPRFLQWGRELGAVHRPE